jgi:flavin-dependent dehydrogenase
VGTEQFDVAIIGGGPAGSTAGTLLKKYMPKLRVGIFEKEKFPRDHVGESQLPGIGVILNEMGCWEKVEAAGFPIKIGATYRWGKSPKLWDFDFLPPSWLKDEPRPANYTGARTMTSFQVDRARYDEILLDHAAECGCEVFQETMMRDAMIDADNPDRVAGLRMAKRSGEEFDIEAKHYIDASGGIGVLRKKLPVKVEYPAALKNVAFWDYWENTDWAVEIGVGGTRVQIMSIGTGWVWFIPLGPTRTSIGFVCPADFYKDSGKSPQELYEWAITQDPRIVELTANASRRGEVEAVKDWSFQADRLAGENWFLSGESAGFADPILAGGMMLTHASARDAAYAILELERGQQDAAWLKEHYSETNRRRVGQHIRFADFWYAGNGQFTDLQEHSAKIAKDAGIDMSPEEAFRWLSTGGFSDEIIGHVGIGGLDLGGAKQVVAIFGDDDSGELEWEISKQNVLKLNLEGAEKIKMPVLKAGRILQADCYVRGTKRLPMVGGFPTVIAALGSTDNAVEAWKMIQKAMTPRAKNQQELGLKVMLAMQAMESMLVDGWVEGSVDETKPKLPFKSVGLSGNFQLNNDELSQRLDKNTG